MGAELRLRTPIVAGASHDRVKGSLPSLALVAPQGGGSPRALDFETVVVGSKPLIVRADKATDSRRLGQLPPGKLLTLLRLERDESGSGVRACVALGDVSGGGSGGDGASALGQSPFDKEILDSWRALYPGKPRWKYEDGASVRSPIDVAPEAHRRAPSPPGGGGEAGPDGGGEGEGGAVARGRGAGAGLGDDRARRQRVRDEARQAPRRRTPAAPSAVGASDGGRPLVRSDVPRKKGDGDGDAAAAAEEEAAEAGAGGVVVEGAAAAVAAAAARAAVRS